MSAGPENTLGGVGGVGGRGTEVPRDLVSREAWE